MTSRFASFGYAFRGLALLYSTQVHAKIHLAFTVAVVALAWGFGVSPAETALLALCIGIVWGAEAFNTAIETLVDLVHPEYGRAAGEVKDLAPGAVLAVSIASFFVGIAVFLPYLKAHYDN